MMDGVIALAQHYSKCSDLRLLNTWFSLKSVDKRGIPGAFVECGVWKGGNVMVARMASPDRDCWLFDTFDGMTEPGPNDTKRNGKAVDIKKWTGKSAVSVHDVRQNLIDVGVYDPEKFRFIIGDVCKTLPKFGDFDLPEIAVLRLDTDFYESTKIELEVLYPRLAVGGILIVDDYGYWLGARRAVDEYLGPKTRHLMKIDETGVFMVKP